MKLRGVACGGGIDGGAGVAFEAGGRGGNDSGARESIWLKRSAWAWLRTRRKLNVMARVMPVKLGVVNNSYRACWNETIRRSGPSAL
jgi:hypothetical protein